MGQLDFAIFWHHLKKKLFVVLLSWVTSFSMPSRSISGGAYNTGDWVFEETASMSVGPTTLTACTSWE